MKYRKRTPTINPFVSKEQRAACFAKDDPAWDCAEWEAATPKGKKLPKRKKKTTTNARKVRRISKYDPTRTIQLRQAIVKEMKKRFDRLKISLFKLIVTEDALGLKPSSHNPLVGNVASAEENHYTLSWEERRTQLPQAGRLIEVPDVRQRNHWTCGAAATFAVSRWFGVGATTLEETAQILGTNVEQSTHPEAIVAYLSSQGLYVEARHGLTTADLARYTQQGMPVICPVQDYGNRREAGASFAYGHYLTVIGVGMGGRIFCQDSSIENVERIPGGDVPESAEDVENIAEPGRIMVLSGTWLRNWHDENIDGNKYIHFGIAVGRSAPIQNVAKECPLDPDECDEEEEIDSGTKKGPVGMKAQSVVLNTRWKFSSDPEKVKAFQAWLKAQFSKDLTDKDTEELWARYARAGFEKGASRAFDDTRKAQRALAVGDPEKESFYQGGREEFLRSAFGRPEAVEKIQLLAGRSFDEMEGVTSDMGVRMSRTLTDGLVQGKNPLDIAKDLNDDLDIGAKRAEMIARTEIIRCHASGQLYALEQLGVDEVGVEVEFTVTDDNVLCPRCESLAGVVMDIKEAQGIIPVHPGCRCAWLPSISEDQSEQKRGAEKDEAIEASGVLNQIRAILNESGIVPDQEEGKVATDRVVRRRGKRGKTIGVPAPADYEDVIKTECQTGQENLEEREAKARDDEEAPSRNLDRE